MLKKSIQIILLLALLVIANKSYTQNKYIDSLLLIIQTETNKVDLSSQYIELARAYQQSNDSLALTYSTKAIELSQSINHLFGIAEGYRYASSYYISNHQPDTAIKGYIKAANLFEKIDSLKRSAKCHSSLATIYTRKDEYAKAYESIGTAKELYEQINDLPGMADIYANYGVLEAFQNNYMEAITFFQQALNLYRELNDLRKITDCLNNIGVIYNWKGDHKKSIEFQEKALEASRQANDSTSMARGLLNLGASADDMGEFDLAIQYYEEALVIKIKNKDEPGISMCYNNLGEAYNEKGEYTKAIEYYEKSLTIDTKLEDNKGRAICLLNIGSVHFKQANYTKAIEYYNESYEIAKSNSYKKIMAKSLNSLGEANINIDLFDKAIEQFKSSFEISAEIGDVSEKGKSDFLLGKTYLKLRKFNTAINYLNLALELHTELGEKQEISNDYIAIGQSWYELGKFSKAVSFGKKAYQIGEEIQVKEIKRDAAALLKNGYARQANYEKAYYYSNIFKQNYDSLNNIEMHKQINLVENRFEVERQKQEIIIHKTQLERQNVEIIKNNIVEKALLIGAFLGLLIVSLLIVVFYRERKAKNIISEQKNDIEDKNEEMHQTNEELRVTLETFNIQNKKIEKINREITDSIHYAKYIQKAILPKPLLLKKLLNNYFVLYKPKDIVSGDFYWVTELEGRTIIAAVDCTGHGVPGGFMSMLGVSFLNDIINKEYITHPGVILRRLRKEVINALQQKGVMGEQRDGMDIALCSIDYKTLELQFSGAHNPLYIIRKNTNTPINDAVVLAGETHTLYEIKGDRMPISLYEKMDRFATVDIQLEKDDYLYIFSDGYADQFGGERGKRFKYKPFKEIILQNFSKSMDEQQKILSQNFAEWKQGYEQIDDVLVLGFQV